jgi:hypothetical protein
MNHANGCKSSYVLLSKEHDFHETRCKYNKCQYCDFIGTKGAYIKHKCCNDLDPAKILINEDIAQLYS